MGMGKLGGSASASLPTPSHPTTPQDASNSHKGMGWEELTDAAITAVSRQRRGVVFLLWGKPAQVRFVGNCTAALHRKQKVGGAQQINRETSSKPHFLFPSRAAHNFISEPI